MRHRDSKHNLFVQLFGRLVAMAAMAILRWFQRFDGTNVQAFIVDPICSRHLEVTCVNLWNLCHLRPVAPSAKRCHITTVDVCWKRSKSKWHQPLTPGQAPLQFGAGASLLFGIQKGSFLHVNFKESGLSGQEGSICSSILPYPLGDSQSFWQMTAPLHPQFSSPFSPGPVYKNVLCSNTERVSLCEALTRWIPVDVK